MKGELLSILRQRNDFVSGQELCEHLGVSRTAIWKAIKSLKDKGYEIESVTNKGYKLISQQDDLSEGEIKSRLDTKVIGHPVYFKESTGSTNVDVKDILENGGPEGVLVVADKQVSGRGRRGRSWESPEKVNIYMSLGLRPEYAPDIAPMVTLIMAMAVANAVDKALPEKDVFIKWPNDVIVGGKKICGILTEMSVEEGYVKYVVIGTGINVNDTDFPEEIKKTATSILLEKGEKALRSVIIADTMKAFEAYYESFKKSGDLSLIREIYEKRLVNMGKKVRVLDPKGEYEGTALGINERGELKVRKDDGDICEVYAGEVSVRGIYGYV